tara:strand:- start:601 stop:1800 length:1200 start_codon:yes stop_codon:yes gene_type:complete
MAYIGRQLTQGEFIKLDSIQSQFDGSQTTFDLKATGQAYSPGAANALLVSLAGVIQESGIAYTVDDSQITFTTAPAIEAEVFILAMGSRVNVGTPSAGTINGSTLVDGTVSANKITSGSIDATKLNSSFGNYGGTISATSFAGDGSALTGIANTADINASTLNVAGVVTATSFAGDGSALTGIGGTENVRTGILDVAGIATFRDNIIATTASFSSDVSIAGTVSIGGTLTYEDVTNVDSVGLITARNGIVVGSGITLSPDGDVFTVGVSTFTGNLDALGGVDVTGNITATSNISDTKGNVRSIPQNSQLSTYTLVAADAGKHVTCPYNVTIPASTFSTGDAITIINNSGTDRTITCSAITTYLANDTSTKSSLTLKARGVCTFIFVSASIVYGAGAGLE